MRFLANENVPLASVRMLESAGNQVVAAAVEMAGASDVEVLGRAVRDDLVVLTFDRDYGELIYRLGRPAPPGIVYFRFAPVTPEEMAETLLSATLIHGLELSGWFTVVDRDRVRQRALPR